MTARVRKPQAAWHQATLCMACANLAAARAAEAQANGEVLAAARRGDSGTAASIASARATDAREAAETAVVRAAMALTGH